MRKGSILFFCFLAARLFAAAQNLPFWVNPEYRNANWPTDSWYIGFAQDNVSFGENVARKMEMVRLEAMNQLSESIIVTVSGQSAVWNASSQYAVNGSMQESMSSEYRQNLYSVSNATIANQTVETCHDANGGKVYAFVSVRKTDLESFYAKQINFALEKALSLEEIASQYAEIGRKISAKEKISEAIDVLTEAECYFTLLSAVNARNPNLDAYRTSEALRKKLDIALSAMDKGPSIYVSCDHRLSYSRDDAFRSDPHIFYGIMTEALSEAKFRISDELDTADYVLALTTYTTERSNATNGIGLISFYANVDGKLLNRRTGQELATFSVFRDPQCYSTGSTAEAAAVKAFKVPALKNKILDKILNSIPQ